MLQKEGIFKSDAGDLKVVDIKIDRALSEAQLQDDKVSKDKAVIEEILLKYRKKFGLYNECKQLETQ